MPDKLRRTKAKVSVRNYTTKYHLFVQMKFCRSRTTINYVTVLPHEVRTIVARFAVPALADWSPAIRLEGYNLGKKVLPLKELRTAGSTN